jgi:hypothetical protein
MQCSLVGIIRSHGMVKRVCAQGEERHYKCIYIESGQRRSQSECARMHFLIEIALGGVAAEIYNRRPESPCSNSTLFLFYRHSRSLSLFQLKYGSPHAACVSECLV